MERLNQEIKRQTTLGKQGLPPLQAVKNIDGLQMFGFLSPPIIQVKHRLFHLFNFTLFYGRPGNAYFSYTISLLVV